MRKRPWPQLRTLLPVAQVEGRHGCVEMNGLSRDGQGAGRWRWPRLAQKTKSKQKHKA